MSALTRFRRSPVAVVALLFLGLVGTGTAYAALVPRVTVEPDQVAAADAERGERLFLANCATCHGRNAEGNPPAGPSLVGVGLASVDFQMGTGRMPLAQPGVQAPDNFVVNFSAQDIADIGVFIDSLGGGPGLPDPQYLDPAAGDLAAGGAIFRTNCAMCHNSSGSGGALTNGKYAPSLMNVSEQHIYEAMITGPQSMPVFNDATITPEEKQDVIAFLKFMEEGGNDEGGASLGALGPAGDALFVWTAGIGLLLAMAVWLGRKAR